MIETNSALGAKAAKKAKPSLKYLRDKDREKVTGIFNYKEMPNGILRFSCKFHKDDQIERFEFVDGETYTIPLGVAKHLNRNGWYPVNKHAVDKNGRPVARLGAKVRRFGFQSLEFIDPEDFSTVESDLVTVEHIL